MEFNEAEDRNQLRGDGELERLVTEKELENRAMKEIVAERCLRRLVDRQWWGGWPHNGFDAFSCSDFDVSANILAGAMLLGVLGRLGEDVGYVDFDALQS